jgi:glycosyltransferase involved in cell wall biosynthesis
MRVLAVNQFYPPDLSATSQLLGELCEDLVARGHYVDVIASQGTYLGGERLPAREVLRGVHVRRLLATSLGKRTRAHRMADYLTFWASAVGSSLVALRPDVLLALTTPPMIAFGLAGVTALRNVPLVTWIQDVYPEIAVAFGVLQPRSVAYRSLRAAATATHRFTSRVVALSDGMAEHLVHQGARRSTVCAIPNWADGQLIRPIPRDENPFRRQHGFGERFIVMYSGNLGQGHDVETLIGTARILHRIQPEVEFVFIGSGGRRLEAESLAAALPNVRFLPYQRREDLPLSLSAADIHLVSLRPGLDGLLVPSKFYAALAAGRAVFYVGPAACDVATVIRREHLGWEGRNGDAVGLADAVANLVRRPEEWSAVGRRARKVFEECYERSVCVTRWEETLQAVVDRRAKRV